MKITPTQEQLHCIETAKTNNKVVIQAYSGSGKTSVLAMIANEIPLRSLYAAFNKISATQASEKFPDHVACRTTHSLAYAAHGIGMQHKLTRPKDAYVNVAGTGGEIARLLKIKDMTGSVEKVYSTQMQK